MTKKHHHKKDQKKQKINKFLPSRIGGIIFFVLAVLVGFSSYYVYRVITSVPELPNLDMNQYWGPYPMEPNEDVSVRPFSVEFPDHVINDLKERLLHRRPFTPPLENAGFTYGMNSHFLTQVLDYWETKYNFKDREQFLNKYRHYVTKIQGLDIHFMRVKPKVTSAIAIIPLLMLHGWPSSIREFYEIIPQLITPREGYNYVFEVIVPSLPGYGFSQASLRPGLGVAETGVIMHNLMQRIGHPYYYIQGGDWGHAIGSSMATYFPNSVLGFHSNTPVLLFHPLAHVYTVLGSIWPNLILEPELQYRLYPLSEHAAFMVEETGYLHEQATKPDTIGIALTDSPAGLAAYVLEKYSTWTNPSYRQAVDGNLLHKYSLVHLLDNIMIYWVSNSITSSMRYYAENMRRKSVWTVLDQVPTTVPTWGIKFKYDLMFQPDCVLKLKYKNYLQSTVVEDGGHFPAFENPDLLADDIFKAIDIFREFQIKKNYSKTQKGENMNIKPKTIYDFIVKDINGNDIKLEKYKGHVIIIVNIASQCGLTDTNYKQLNELYEKYSTSKGLRILGFPCNQFGGQEPGTPQEILKFTRDKGVKFDLFDKIMVNGENSHPLWKFLKSAQGGTLGDFIKWNFSKFIIDKNGIPVERLGPNVEPLELEPLLFKYW